MVSVTVYMIFKSTVESFTCILTLHVVFLSHVDHPRSCPSLYCDFFLCVKKNLNIMFMIIALIFVTQWFLRTFNIPFFSCRGVVELRFHVMVYKVLWRKNMQPIKPWTLYRLFWQVDWVILLAWNNTEYLWLNIPSTGRSNSKEASLTTETQTHTLTY